MARMRLVAGARAEVHALVEAVVAQELLDHGQEDGVRFEHLRKAFDEIRRVGGLDETAWQEPLLRVQFNFSIHQTFTLFMTTLHWFPNPNFENPVLVSGGDH